MKQDAPAPAISTRMPIPGAIAWTGAGHYGHLAYMESVSGGMVTVSEMNYKRQRDRVTWRSAPAYVFRCIYWPKARYVG